MASFKDFLKEKLKGKIPTNLLELLPKGYQLLGQVCILNLKKELLKYRKLIAETSLNLIPSAKTICLKTDIIKGQFREPSIEVLAGEKNTVVKHHEFDCVFEFDISKIMWSKGNMNERQRLASLIKKNEIVVDFFAGLGYWVIPIAKHCLTKRIIAIELNPVAFKFLQKNIILNLVSDKIEAINGDCVEVAKKLNIKADRIILGLIPSPFFALPAALSLSKKGTIIHFEGIASTDNPNELFEEVRKIALENKRTIKLIKANEVKSFSPHKSHFTLDIQVLN